MKKNNISEGAAKFLFGVVIILVACVGIGITIYVMNEGKNGTNKNMAQFNSITSQYTDVEKEKYHGMEVQGSMVLEVIEKALDSGDVVIEYSTLAAPTPTVAATTTLDLAPTATNYINPYGIFLGDVEKDANGVVETINFKQIKK